MDDAGWYRMHCHLHWIFFCKSKISATMLLLVNVHSLSLQEFRLYCNARAWNMRKSFSLYIDISQSILLQWNHVCFSSEIWLHATTKPTTWNINKHIHILAPIHNTHSSIYVLYKHEFCTVPFIYTHPSFLALIWIFLQCKWKCIRAKNIMSHLSNISAIRVVHVTPLTILKPI